MSLRQIFVMNEGSFQDHNFADASEVPAGTIAAFDLEGNSVQIADGADGDTIQDTLEESIKNGITFVLGGNENILTTTVIREHNFNSVTKRAYSAPTPQVTTISDIGVASADGSSLLKVIDLTDGYEQFPRISYDVAVKEGDTAAVVAQRLVDRVNSVRRSAVTATLSGSDVVLTAKRVGTNFTVATSEALEGATVTGTTAPDTGSGTYEQIRDEEIKYRGFMYGEYYTNDGILGSPEPAPVNAQSGKSYNMYTVRVKNNIDESVDAANRWHELVFCVATTGVTGDMDAFFGIT